MILTSKYDTTSMNHRLVPLSSEEREIETGYNGERTHPTARQYAVHRYGSPVGTLIKWWLPSPSPGVPGGWFWTFREGYDEMDFETLALAKRALSVTR